MVRRVLIVVLVGTMLLIPRASGATPLRTVASIGPRDAAQQIASSYTPAAIRTAYDFAPLYDQSIDGTGQTVALIEIDRFNPSDIETFDSANSLPPAAITETYVGSRQFSLRVQGETSMDIEWLHALAPGAAIQIYYVNDKQSDAGVWRDMGSALQQVTAAGIKIASISLGACGPGPGGSVVEAAMKAAMKHGVSIFVSSGDTGDRPGTVKDCGKRVAVGYPAGDPSVVSVGGTSLRLSASNLITRELGWNKSGGGQAPKIARPSWQKAAGLPKDTHRWAPDVSFLADPATGVSVYFNGHFQQAGGTSLGAPCWAAIWALARESAANDGVTLGVAPKVLYKLGNSSAYASAFHDITTGSNGHYSAGIGWDPVTGWGTPDVANLVQAIG